MVLFKTTNLLGASLLFLVVGCTAVLQNGQAVATDKVKKPRRYQIDEAQVEVFSRSVRPINGELKAKYELALHFLSLHKHRIAIEVLNEVIEMDPSHASAHNALGLSYDSLGDYETARYHYRQALVISPDMDQAYNNLGYSYLLDGKFSLAIEALQQAIALNDGNTRYHRNLGLAYLKINKVEMATLAFQVADGKTKAESLMARLGLKVDTVQQVDTKQMSEALPNSLSSDHQKREFDLSSNKVSGDQPSLVDQMDEKNISKTSGHAPNADYLKASPKMHVLNSGNAASKVPLIEEFGQEITIEVSNGNGVRKMARSVMNHLKNNGANHYRFRLTNADHFRYPKTVIYYRNGYQEQAQRIKNLLPELQYMGNMVEARLDHDPIRLLIGKDLKNSRIAPQASVKVDVTNGNGVSGMAKRIGELLARKGFFIGRLTNADHFGYDQTTVFYSRGVQKHAEQVAAALPLRAGFPLVEVSNADDARIQVRFGSDMVF